MKIEREGGKRGREKERDPFKTCYGMILMAIELLVVGCWVLDVSVWFLCYMLRCGSGKGGVYRELHPELVQMCKIV